jgi:hypothetical protein
MIVALAAQFGLLAQIAALPAREAPTVRRASDPVRVWRTDSTVQVALEGGGYVTLLHVDPIGRISVLFPLEPDLDAWVPSEPPLRMALPPTAQGNPGTFMAIRSRWPFDFTALRAGATWGYHDAWLLQPTAGDPIAALLDIADRVTDGRSYDYGTVGYTSGGVVASRRVPLQPDVCLGCVRRGTPVTPAAPVAVQTTSVDCSNATMTNSFCGVANASVSITSAPPAAPASPVAYQPPATPPAIYVPYFVPSVARGDRRPFIAPPPAPSASPTVQPARAMEFPVPPHLLVPSRALLRTLTSRRP